MVFDNNKTNKSHKVSVGMRFLKIHHGGRVSVEYKKTGKLYLILHSCNYLAGIPEWKQTITYCHRRLLFHLINA
jgi:hypothetical protein